MSLSQQALSGGIMPQALGQPSMQDRVSVMVQNTPNGLRNVYSDPALHMNVLYSARETPYKSNIACPSGVASVNNECICPGAPSGVPYRQSVPAMGRQYLNSMFVPLEPSMFPQLSATAQTLIAERSPCGPQYYQSMDQTRLTSCNSTC